MLNTPDTDKKGGMFRAIVVYWRDWYKRACYRIKQTTYSHRINKNIFFRSINGCCFYCDFPIIQLRLPWWLLRIR